VSHTDGPWQRPDDFQKTNAVLRYSRGTAQNGFSLTGLVYSADWKSTDQVPQRALDRGLIGRFGLIDPSNGGQENRQMAVADWQRTSGSTALRATGYTQRNSLNLFSNFTYFLDHPDVGDQFEQAERRVTAGGRVTVRHLGRVFARRAESVAGVQVRRDWLRPVGLYHTAGAERLSTTREDRVGQTMAGVFAQTEIEWSRTLRTMVGVRADAYQYAVRSDTPLNSGRGVSGLVNPKLGMVFGPWAGKDARLTPWMTVDGDLSFSRARFTETSPAGAFVPGALDRVVSAGLAVEPSKTVFGSLRLRHFGPRPLVEDASVRSSATSIWNGEIGYRLSGTARLVLEGYNLFDATVADIDYFYTSRLPGDPAEGVDDVHTHPAIPRTARLSLQLSF